MKAAFFVSGVLVVGVALAVPYKTHGSNAPAPKSTKVDFNKFVRPILSEHCYKCHGPDAKDGMAGLRLDLHESAIKERNGRWAIKPGSSAHSGIIDRVTADPKDGLMPPPDSGTKPLTKEEVAILKKWIDEGAEYKKHWAFIPPANHEVPTVSNPNWCKNEIDKFVLARLDESGLKPAAEAPKETLLRRVSYTLTGLPPTPEETAAFLNDKSPNAYEKVVDRLLSSPRYGEHQARYWLDAVRYGDTHGMHIDNERAIYPYRDWVVRSFNRDLSFDKFTLWQMAGDMLPQPTLDQKIASGYIRMNPTTNEGGVIEEEFQVRNTFDRVDTTSTVYLGMTIGCAKCHSHKFDPVTHKDYYGLFAFFNSTKDAPLDGNLRAPDPVMKAPNPDQRREMDQLQGTLQSLRDQTNLDQAKSWLLTNAPTLPKVGAWTFAGPYKFGTFDEAYDKEVAKRTEKPISLKEGDVVVWPTTENASGYYHTTFTATQAKTITLRLRSDDAIKAWLNGEAVHANKALRGVVEAEDAVVLNLKQGDNDFVAKVVNASGPNGFAFRIGSAEELERSRVINSGTSNDIRDLYLRQGPASGMAKTYRSLNDKYAKINSEVPLTLIAQELDKPRQAYLLRRGEYDQRADKVERGIPAALGTWPANTPLNRLGFAEWLMSPENPLTMRVFVNRIWQQHFGTGIVKTAEDFGSQGEWPSHPELLDYLAIKFRQDGMSIKKLHKLIVTSAAFRQASVISDEKKQKDPENRLISRGPRFRLDAEVLRDSALAVSGLLKESAGGRGFRPYQPPGLWEEVAFDPSVSDTAVYKMDETDAIYRRTLYLFWKRTSPHPMMSTFDAPTREACVVRRARTNTPLQALLTMNEPGFVESSRVFAQRILEQDCGDKDRMKWAFEFALGRAPSTKEVEVLDKALARYTGKFEKDPTSAEKMLKVGLAPRDPQLPAPKLAAWTLVANTLFNTDEFLTQH